jgi:hypothetical protein
MSLTCDPYWALLKSQTPWHKDGPSWSWTYGSWLYNYLCNRCISPLMLWVRIPLMARCTTLCDQVCQWLAADRCFFCLLRFYPRIKQTATIWLKEALNIIKPNKNHWHKWELTTLVVICTDYIGSWITSYHTVMTTTAHHYVTECEIWVKPSTGHM